MKAKKIFWVLPCLTLCLQQQCHLVQKTMTTIQSLKRSIIS